MARKQYPYPLAEVHWLDAETTHGWEDEDENEPVVPVVITVGFLIKDTPELICIASTTSRAKDHNGRIIIPRGMVQSLKILKK